MVRMIRDGSSKVSQVYLKLREGDQDIEDIWSAAMQLSYTSDGVAYVIFPRYWKTCDSPGGAMGSPMYRYM